VIGEVLGVAVRDLWQFKRWCDDVNDILAFTPTLEGALVKQESVRALRTFLWELIEARRAHRTDDLLSSLVDAEEEGDRLSEAELIQTCTTLMIAAHETTTNLIGNGLLALLSHPVELQRFRDDPSITASAVEELLRYDGPLNHVPRVAAEELEVGGQRIGKGEVVTFSLLAANRDPDRFHDPDRLDLARPDNDHLAFGFGVHFCLGAPLARIEGAIALRTVVDRFAGLRLVAEPAWRHDRVGHGVEGLRVVA
jgi:cytochrome P450